MADAMPRTPFSQAGSQRSQRSNRGLSRAASETMSVRSRGSSRYSQYSQYSRRSGASGSLAALGASYFNEPEPGSVTFNKMRLRETSAGMGSGMEWREDRMPELQNSRPQSFFGRDRAGVNIPGYKGYIPGKVSDNIFGQTFARSNSAAAGLGPPATFIG
eukprot:TRINITY_DN6212_c0_g1_i1.p1 TRINITY_DN6212_c0_g1~~TRINITY_DN6212_c0_g1_i1.p1  ORF type:complete len:182 (-),score=25.16 TRINITY_DN6212_c0_g1_i1:96-575(-)